MSSKQCPNRLNINLGTFKEPWLHYCRANKTTPSEAFRLIVAKLTGAVRDQPIEEPDEGGKVRREIRLTHAELVAAELIAAKEGFRLSRWIVALIRARLESSAQLGQQELEALARSNLQVLAVGRNLNQIAKALAAAGAPDNERYAELIHSVNQLIQAHAKTVAGVLASNMQRWSAK
jgi:hypothetical protein